MCVHYQIWMGRFCKRSAVQQQTTYQIREKKRGKQINRWCRVNTSKISKRIAYSATISPIFVDQLMTQLKYIFHKKKGNFWRQCIFFKQFISSFHSFIIIFMHSSKANYVLENFDHKLGLRKAPHHSPLGAEKAICEWKACAQGAFTRSSTTLFQKKLS